MIYSYYWGLVGNEGIWGHDVGLYRASAEENGNSY